MKLACLRAGQLLTRRTQGLSAHEGLRLEEHLASCSSCRGQSNLLHELTKLSTHIPMTLDDGMRERAIANAFGASAQARMFPSPAAKPWPLLLGAAAISFAVALLVVVPRFGTTPDDATAARPDRVLSGRIELAGKSRGVGQELGEHEALRSIEGATVALAHAQVELRPQTDARWDASARKLHLEHGSVLVEVDPTPHRSFSVQTAHFNVQVLGTRFVVTERAVYVQRGRVAVETMEDPGAPIILAAGSAQTQFELDAAPAPAPPAADGGVGPRDSARPAVRKAAASGGRTTADPRALLEEARTQLAARQLEGARRTLALAAPKLKRAALRAEALSLEAEASLLEGRFEAARDTYLRVAKRFPQLAAAETALFAAARIEAEHGEPARAQALLTDYLTRYPNGSYRREAERRLQTHSGPAR